MKAQLPGSTGSVFGLLLAVAACCCLPARAAPQPAAEPQQHMETPLPPAHGAIVQVRAGEDLQAALARASPGDVIELEAGAQYRGPFVLPKKAGNEWIVIRSSAVDKLPPDTRINPATAAPLLATLTADSGSALFAVAGAHHYRFIGIEVRPAPSVALTNLVELGSGKEQMQDLPHHFVFDRCYLHGDAQKGTRRGIAMNGAHIAVINSWLSDFKEVGADSQALAGWNGPGPFLIANNHLEGAGENVMFGGGTPAIRGLVASDIEIRGNHFFKPLSWKAGDVSFEQTPWSVKNLLELKNAQRVLVEGNVFEHNWVAAQNGFSILFTVRNEDGAAPWATVSDVNFRKNVLTGIASGINVLGHDDNSHPSGQTSRLTISNNLFTHMGGSEGGGTLLQLLDGTRDFAFDHNTAHNTGSILVGEGRAHTNASFSCNIVMHNRHGIIGSGTGTGLPTLQRYFPSLSLDHNVIIGGEARLYPPDNVFPASAAEAGLSDKDASDLRLARGMRVKDKDCGVDYTTLCAALSPDENNRYCRASVGLH